jgi:hypothetical protein
MSKIFNFLEKSYVKNLTFSEKKLCQKTFNFLEKSYVKKLLTF